MSRWMAALVAFSLLFVAVPGLLAHHGTARFDTTRVVTRKGTVTGFEWVNPHPQIHVDIQDDKGKVENWLLECGSPLMLTRFGWTKDTVKAGDAVTVYGFRAKDGTPYMHLERIELPNGKALPGFP